MKSHRLSKLPATKSDWAGRVRRNYQMPAFHYYAGELLDLISLRFEDWARKIRRRGLR